MKTINLLILIALVITFSSCKKYLDAKPDSQLSTPSSLNDLQQLLDYYGMNSQFTGSSAILSDNYYLPSDTWASLYWDYQRNYYKWQRNENDNVDWSQPYKNIFTCNVVLETLKNNSWKQSEQVQANNLKGAALFFRASYFYGLAQLFCKGYNKTTSDSDLGIPLKLSTDFKEKSKRASLEKTYHQIISDLKEAASLLPTSSSVKTRPTKAAAYGSLARTFLAMQDYINADVYADSCLKLVDALIDYNSLDSNAADPVSRFNDEVIFQAISLSVDPIAPYYCKIDSNLYNSYTSNDLRKVILFSDNDDGTHYFKGDYDGGSENWGHSFTGIVTDEQYLIKAECDARLGNIENALKYLNTLMSKRIRADSFNLITTTSKDTLLSIILEERRKELLFRGTRLTDLKRLNQDSRFAVTLIRKLNDTTYKLLPNDPGYVALIPKQVIDMSGMKQNQ
jgi:hypothetical protein